MKQSEKRHFSDPAMACAMLNLNPSKLMKDLNTFGFLFETLVERDLSIYAQSLDAKIYHYQDYKDNEIDSIIEFKDGSWCAIEIKLGINEAEETSNSLTKVCNDIFLASGQKPIFKCVIYGSGNLAFKDKNGVYIFPITALKN